MKIPYQIYRFSLTTLDELYLPSFKGSTLRGGFGNAFRKVVCALKKKECGDCLLKKNCIYSYIFETTLDSVKLNQRYVPANEKIPHPFVIEPPMSKSRRYDVGEVLSFYLVLVQCKVDFQL